MRIGLITTLDTNIGDDFIREGLCSVLRDLVPEDELVLVPINKHKPISLYPDWHPLRRIRNLPIRGYRKQQWLRQASRIFKGVGRTQFDDCDAIVQCGAPVYWPGCGTSTEWHNDLWKDVVARLHRRIPVLNLAAGSCFPYRDQPERFEDKKDAAYAKWLFDLCRATAVRDPLAKKLLSAEGREALLIRCSAFLFTTPAQAAPVEDGPILINYMPGGGHYDWDQNIDAEKWARTVSELIGSLRRKHKVVMFCHNQKELDAARALAPELEAIMPETYADFPRLLRTAKAALCNRMHASVALAGMGIPSVTVGTDTRLLMVNELELPCYFVSDATAAQMESDLERLIAQREKIAARLLVLQNQTRDAYAEVFRRHLPLSVSKEGTSSTTRAARGKMSAVSGR